MLVFCLLCYKIYLELSQYFKDKDRTPFHETCYSKLQFVICSLSMDEAGNKENVAKIYFNLHLDAFLYEAWLSAFSNFAKLKAVVFSPRCFSEQVVYFFILFFRKLLIK